jgi:hypothetical protein
MALHLLQIWPSNHGKVQTLSSPETYAVEKRKISARISGGIRFVKSTSLEVEPSMGRGERSQAPAGRETMA